MNLLPGNKKISKDSFLVPISNISSKTYNKNISKENANLKYDKKIKSEDTLLTIKRKVISIEKLLKNNFILQKKEIETQKKNLYREKISKREKKMETPKAKAAGVSFPSTPSVGLFDRIQNFLFFTGIGWLVTKFWDQLPQLTKFVDVLGATVKTVADVFSTLGEGFISFIDWGYKAYDGIRSFTKSIGGEKLQKTFDDFSGNLNKFLNAAIVIALAVGTIGDKQNRNNRNNRNNRSGNRNNPTDIRGSRNLPGRSRYGASSNAARRYAERFGRDAAVRKFGSEGVRSLGGKYARSSATNLARKGAVSLLGKGGTKAVLKFAKPFLKRLPLIGGLIDFGLSVAMGEPLGRAAFKAIGATVLGAIGTGFGGPLGAILGGFAGDWAGGKLYDIFFGGQKNVDNKSTQKKTSGGQVTRKGVSVGRPAKRSIKIQKRRPQKTKKIESQPGKDVGGKNQIQKLFPDPKVGKNPFQALLKTSKSLKEIPSFIGALMGAGVDVALGQRPDRKVYESIGNAITYFVETISNQQVQLSINNLTKSIAAMSGGGVVPSSFTPGSNSVEVFSKTFGIVMESKVNTALRDIMKELTGIGGSRSRSPGAGGGGGGGYGGSGGGGAGGYAQGEENFVSSKEVYDYIRSKGLSHNHAMGMLANIQAESSFNAGAIGDSGTSGGLFQHHAERFDGMVAYAGKNWAKNWKRQVDYALREGSGKQYIEKEFTSAADASAWFTLNFERPSNKEQKAKDRIDNLTNFGSDGSWKGAGGGPSPAEIKEGDSRVSSDIKEFRKFRAAQFGASSERKPTAGGEYYQVRELGIYGRKDYQINPLADDTAYEINEHRGAGHWENRAFDIPVPNSSVEGDKVAQYWKSRGYDVIWRSDGHYDHVHVEVPKDKADEFFKIVKKEKKEKEKEKAQKGQKVVMQGQTAVTLYGENDPRRKPKQSSKSWWDPLGVFGGGKPQQQAVKPTHGGGPNTRGYGKQGGGILGSNNIQRYSGIDSYASYNQPNSVIAIQTIIVEKPVPVASSGSNKSISFPNLLNSSTSSLSRG
jgi:hypothetical protein